LALLFARGGRKGGSSSTESKHVDEGAEGNDSGHVQTYADRLSEWEDPNGRPRIGRLYQGKSGDTLLTVAREALFGTREPRREPRERQAVIDLSIRIDCSPWNQAVAGRPRDELEPGHYAVTEGWTTKGVSFQGIHADNRARLAEGEPPSVGGGSSFPYFWIPMIDLDALEVQGEVTTYGMNYPDDGYGSYSMIDPPPWVIDLGFDDVNSAIQVGCDLPEGDFRSEIVPDEE
jgi:hypothetical protein